jgi:hypothetical protein
VDDGIDVTIRGLLVALRAHELELAFELRMPRQFQTTLVPEPYWLLVVEAQRKPCSTSGSGMRPCS